MTELFWLLSLFLFLMSFFCVHVRCCKRLFLCANETVPAAFPNCRLYDKDISPEAIHATNTISILILKHFVFVFCVLLTIEMWMWRIYLSMFQFRTHLNIFSEYLQQNVMQHVQIQNMFSPTTDNISCPIVFHIHSSGHTLTNCRQFSSRKICFDHRMRYFESSTSLSAWKTVQCHTVSFHSMSFISVNLIEKNKSHVK